MGNKKINSSNAGKKNRTQKHAMELNFETDSPAANKILKAQILTLPLSLIITVLIPSYFPILIARQLVFYGADSNCVTNGAAFGNHCFGDFGALINGLKLDGKLWIDLGTPYPPFNLMLMDFFNILTSLPSPGILLTFYITTLIVSMSLPIWWATARLGILKRILITSIFSISTIPGIATIDRGNNLVWSLPFLYKGLIEISQGNFRRSIPFMALAISLRPQLAIFAILYLLARQMQSLLKLIFATMTIYLVSFMYFSGFDIRQTVIKYTEGVLSYGSGIPATWPPNLGLARGLKSIFEMANWNVPDDQTIMIGNFILLLVLVKIVLLNRRDKVEETIFILIPIIFLVSAMTWAYYGVYLFVGIAVMIHFKSSNFRIGSGNRSLGNAYLICTGITLSPLFLPFRLNYENFTQYLVPISWTLFYLAFILVPKSRFQLKEAE
jgi:hypothetical protein